MSVCHKIQIIRSYLHSKLIIHLLFQIMEEEDPSNTGDTEKAKQHQYICEAKAARVEHEAQVNMANVLQQF